MNRCSVLGVAILVAVSSGTAQAQVPQITTMAQARFYAALMAHSCGHASAVCTCVGKRALQDAIGGTVPVTWQTAWDQLRAGSLKYENTLPLDQRARTHAIGLSLDEALLPGAVESIYQDACPKPQK